MEIIFSKHFYEQCKLRNLEQSKLLTTIKNPDTIIVESLGIKIYQKVFEEKQVKYLYRVFINEEKNPPLAVTAYRTSKINKYEN